MIEEDKVLLQLAAKADSYNYVLEILEMIKYYFFECSVNFSRNLLKEALQYLRHGKNPFLYIKSKMEAEIEDLGANYGLSHDVFYYHLPGDSPHEEKPKVPTSTLFAYRINTKQLIKCKVCQKYEWELFYDADKKQLTLLCVECHNLRVFQMKEV